MIAKQAKSSFLKSFFKWIIAGEVAAIGGTYAFYHYLNQNRDFRLKVYRNYPIIVDYYYSIGETLNKDYKGREIDLLIWTKEGKLN